MKYCAYRNRLENFYFKISYSEEGRAMMGYNLMNESPSNFENNNNNNNAKNEKTLNKKKATVQYSSHSKGMLAQVKYIITIY